MTAYHWRLLIVLMVAETISAFEASMILAGLAAWQRELRDPVLVGWIVTSYLLVSAAAAALLGRLGDIFGRKLVLVCVIATAGIGSVISAFSDHVYVIIFGRGIQGAAGAIIPLCYGLVREHLPKDRVPFGVSMIVATAATASAIGLLLGGILTDNFGPGSIFWSSAALALLVAPIVAFGLPRSPSSPMPKNFDWMGGILYAPGVGALLYALSRIGDLRSSMAPYIALGMSLLLLGWWYRHERKHPSPLMDVSQLTNRTILIANLGMLAAAAGVMQLTQVTSILIQQPTATGTGLGQSATFLGAVKLPTVLIGVLGSLSAGWMIVRFGQRLPILLGGLLIAAPTALLAIEQTSLAIIISVICLTSVGINMVYAAIPTVIMGAIQQDRTSEATGLMAVFRATGQAFGAQMLAVLMSLSLVNLSDGRVYTDYDGFLMAFMYIAFTGGLVMATTLFIRSHKFTRAPVESPV
jgi:MFS family permease